MKKFILMLCLAAFSLQMSYAQTDLQVTGLMPVDNGVYDSIADNELVTFSVVIKNNGPSNLGFTDTVFLDMDLEWLIGFPGYVFRGTYVANALNSMFSGSSDTLSFAFNQNVSLGQTPAGNAIPVVPNHEFLNDITFKVYGYTATFNLLNDSGINLDGNGSIVVSGNNLYNPTNVIFGLEDTPVLAVVADVATICEGSPVTFTASVTDPGSNPSYQWKVNNMNVGTSSPTFTSTTLVDNDEISCTYTSTVNGASMDITSAPIIASVTPALIPSIALTVSPGTTVQVGLPVEFSTTITNGGLSPNYIWYRNQTVIPGATSFTYSAIAGADFIDGDEIYVSLTSSETCVNPEVANSSTLTMEVTTVGIESLSTGKDALITLSPNPNNGRFILSIKDIAKGIYMIRAINVLGQPVFTKSIRVENSIQEEIEIEGLPNGTYYLVLSNENGRLTTSKFLIQN